MYGAGWAWALAAWIWVIIWHPWMDVIKFWANGWLFKRNIPLIHPYSEVDQRRDRMLEIKAKQAHRPHRRVGDVEEGGMVCTKFRAINVFGPPGKTTGLIGDGHKNRFFAHFGLLFERISVS